ncbi:MAG TPA: hypothetical protein VFW87_09745, partial [Pirellulales bacterium]|nr:hypothetical protein [Pirellulales bacterium]
MHGELRNCRARRLNRTPARSRASIKKPNRPTGHRKERAGGLDRLSGLCRVAGNSSVPALQFHRFLQAAGANPGIQSTAFGRGL